MTDLATACIHFKTAKIAVLLNPDDISLREPLKHTRWRLQQLSIVDYLRMLEQAHAEASALRGITDQRSTPRQEHHDTLAEDRDQQQHNHETKPLIEEAVKPAINATAVASSAAAGPAVVPEGENPPRNESTSVPDRGHSAKRRKPRRSR